MKRNIRKIALVLSIAMLLIMLAACGSSGNNASPAPSAGNAPADTIGAPVEEVKNTVKSDETLTVMLNGEPNLLLGEGNEAAIIVMESIGGGILEFDSANNSWRPGICTGFETVDETHYSFELRDGVTFSDGTPITAEDCVFSLNFWKETGNSDAQYYDIENTQIVDDKHFTLALTHYTPGWEFALVSQTGIVFSENALNAVGGTSGAERTPPVGAGRYVFKEWQPGSYILVERNENYWDPDYTGYYKYIKYVFVADSASRVLAVKSGDADVAVRITTADMTSIENDPKLQVVTVNTTVYNLIYNNKSGACADPKVREALSYAVDANAVNAIVNMGHGEPVGSWILPEFPFYKSCAEANNYDPEKAKQLLAEAGYPDGIELFLPVVGNNSQAATVVQETMRQAGITLNVQIMEQANYLEVVRAAEHDMILGTAFIRYRSANNYNLFNPELAGRAPQNAHLSGDAAEHVKELIAKCSSSDLAVAEQAWYEMQDYLFGNHVLTCICSTHGYATMRSDLTGYANCNPIEYLDPTGIHPVV